MSKDVIRSQIAIIGMGPAGVTAAIYLKRFGLNPICFEKEKIGGKINSTHEIENYPGFIGSIADLVGTFEKQIKDYELDLRYEQVETVSQDADGKFDLVSDKGFYKFDTVLLCTGLKERPYEIPGQRTFESRGISRCATCDGPFFKNKPVAVLGGGNTAFEEAIYLASICKEVTLINRRHEFRADEKLVEEFKNLPNTKILTPYLPKSCSGQIKIQQIVLENQETKEEMTLDTDALFIYLGAAPVNDFIKIGNLFNAAGFIPTNNLMETSVKGFYVAGDCRDTPLRQIVTATNDGAIAALSIKKFIKDIK